MMAVLLNSQTRDEGPRNGTWCTPCYTEWVIKSFEHKGLKRFFDTGSKAGINPKHADRLNEQLTVLDSAEDVDDVDLPGYRLHMLTGDQAGRWSITVQANWRITFDFIEGDAYIVDYEDYH